MACNKKSKNYKPKNICNGCGIKQTLSNSSLRNDNKDSFRYMCYKCINEAACPLKNKNKALKSKFGITLIQYNQMVENQNNKCAICNQKEIVISNKNNKIQGLSVDHNHKTGKIRDLLCKACNIMIGEAKENPETLLNGHLYLLKH